MAREKPTILHEDSALLLVNKPAGWLTVPTPKGERDTLRDWADDYLRSSGTKAYMVHRLDRETSGVLAIAKKAKAQQALEQQFRTHEPGRTYLALVHGTMAQKKGRLVHNLMPDPRRKGAVMVSRNRNFGQHAALRYATLEEFGEEAALLEIAPETGRTNQIRVQLAHEGHPIVGDRKYTKARKWRLQARRTLLHAASLSVAHPDTKKQVSAKAPLPADFEEALATLRGELKGGED
ncbi:MAG: RluA family pseudouridine synthase [Chrysiogenetes bacterium]|nr:RluA family pseudouridine synthase [Chrysiogenetes bacterium]